MRRYVIVATVSLVGCTSNTQQLENVGVSSAAIGEDYTIDTRGHDNGSITSLTPYSLPSGGGGGGPGTPGMCYLTKVAGSFRGFGESLQVGQSNGYIALIASADTHFDDQTPNDGPRGTMHCVTLSNLGASPSQISSFFSGTHFTQALSVGVGGTGASSIGNGTAGQWSQFAGVNGRMRSVTATGEGGSNQLLSTGDELNANFQDVCTASPTECAIRAYGIVVWSTLSFTYVPNGATATGNQDLPLSNSSTTLCMINYLSGYWDNSTSAVIQAEGDGNWHLVQTSSAGGGHSASSTANCLPIAQGW